MMCKFNMRIFRHVPAAALRKKCYAYVGDDCAPLPAFFALTHGALAIDDGASFAFASQMERLSASFRRASATAWSAGFATCLATLASLGMPGILVASDQAISSSVSGISGAANQVLLISTREIGTRCD